MALGGIFITILFINYSTNIIKSLNTVEGAWSALMIILIRIAALSGMSFYMFRQWFRQEAQYLSDIPFLFGIFFLFLIFGKFLDLLSDLTFFTITDDEMLFLSKVRYFIAILTLLPMIYLSIGMILYYLSLKNKYERYKDENIRDKTRIKILVPIVFIEMIGVIFSPDITFLGSLLPIFVIPSLITIVWLFIFAYKHQRLSQVHPLILAIGFGIYLISNMSRPLSKTILGETAQWIILCEIIDLLIFLIIFSGLVLKVKYKVN